MAVAEGIVMMSEEFNIVTVGDTYKTTVICDNKPYHVLFYVGTRAGATEGMIKKTLRHFISALNSVANGDVAADELEDKSGDYLPCTHNEARVSIWVKAPGIPVLLEHGMRFIQVNVFTEGTSAQNFIDAVYEHVNTMSIVLDSKLVSLSNGNAQQPAPKPQSVLDEYFPRDDKPQATAQAPVNTSTPPTVSQSGDSVYIGGYDYKKKQEYIDNYAGKTVIIDICKMSRIFDRDGNQVIEVHSSYNGGESKYPSHDIKIKQNRLERVDEFTSSILSPMFEAKQGDKPEDNNRYFGTYFMFVPQDDTTKCYPLLTKLVDAQAHPEQPVTVAGQEIPFGDDEDVVF